MRDGKFVRSRSWGLHNSMRSSKGLACLYVAPYRVVGVAMSALLLLVLLVGPVTLPGLSPAQIDDNMSAPSAHEKSKLGAWRSKGIISTLRNTSFYFSPRVSNMDMLRKSWRKANPNVRNGRPKILLVTGSQPIPCDDPVDTQMFLKTAKNKIHYARMQDIQMHYSLIEPEKEFVRSWTKISVIRMLMVTHVEVEWFWWMDSDTVVTDMEFEPPLHRYRGHNFVVYGDDHRVHDVKDWRGLITGNFLIRNCQWSLDFLDAWGSMGSAHSLHHVGQFLSDSLFGRAQGLEADDQSALVYLLTTEKEMWAPKVFLEKDIFFTGSWIEVVKKLESLDSSEPEVGRIPAVTQFGECYRCGGKSASWPWEKCKHGMELALDFADNQVYRGYGYQLPELGVPRLEPIRGHKVQAVTPAAKRPLGEFHGFPIHKLPGPAVDNWDAQRRAWFKRHPNVSRTNDHGMLKTMIVTGSSTKECSQSQGAQFLLQAMKNKVDYARFHDMQMFYSMVDFDRALDYWWTKIPTLRVLMLAHPEVEWFWWCDSDAVITDMVFDPPFEKFNADGQNLVLYGDHDLVFNKHDWIGLNAGVYLVRNCQWSLDLFDAWASFGAKENRVEAGRKCSQVLDLPGQELNKAADDQSTLLYILITDKERQWLPHVRLERSFTISGYWKDITLRFESMKVNAHPGLGNLDWPWVVHFAGCQPCGLLLGNFDANECQKQIKRSFDFSDDQVLRLYGLQHSSLGNPEVLKLKPSSLKLY